MKGEANATLAGPEMEDARDKRQRGGFQAKMGEAEMKNLGYKW
jgi:hypothetical protein